MADLATLQGYLIEALDARHKLLTGQKEASVSYEGKSVSFAATDLGRIHPATTAECVGVIEC